jgi:hypothetical protein
MVGGPVVVELSVKLEKGEFPSFVYDIFRSFFRPFPAGPRGAVQFWLQMTFIPNLRRLKPSEEIAPD